MPAMPIAVLISGGGSTLKNLIEYRSAGLLPVDFRLVISSKSSAGGLEYARTAKIPYAVIGRKKFASAQEHSEAVFEECRQKEVQYVVMGGYLDHLLIPDDFQNRVINIHPSLIPSFCGHGFYGLRVHQAAVDYGVKLSGCTVHFVDNEFDHGPIIAQRTCPVLCDDTAESLQARVLEVERQLYPEIIAAIAAGRVHVQARRVEVNI